MWLRVVVVILMDHGAAVVVTQLRGCHRWTLQVTTEIFDAAPGPVDLSGKVNFPVTTVLRLQIAPPLSLIAKVPQPWQAAGTDTLIAVTQQANNGSAPDFFDLFLFKEDVAPAVMLNIEAAPGDGQVDMGMLPKLAAIGVQGAENADFDAHFAGKAEHGPSGTAKQVIEQRPVVVEKGQSIWGMVKVICCQSQSGRMCYCSAIHCPVAFMPQELQAFDLQL